MPKSTRSKKRRAAKRGDQHSPSAVALQARLRGGAGVHVKRTPRAAAKRQAIHEHS